MIIGDFQFIISCHKEKCFFRERELIYRRNADKPRFTALPKGFWCLVGVYYSGRKLIEITPEQGCWLLTFLMSYQCEHKILRLLLSCYAPATRLPEQHYRCLLIFLQSRIHKPFFNYQQIAIPAGEHFSCSAAGIFLVINFCYRLGYQE